MTTNNSSDDQYWSQRYRDNNIGWDIGHPSMPLKAYFDQLKDPSIRILIPGAGNAYEAEYLYNKGFKNVFIMDISKIPLKNFKKRNPDFPDKQLIHDDFFIHNGQYDLIIEQTFFCSFPPLVDTRNAYVKQMHQLLKSEGKLVGLWFDIPLKGDLEKRPFGGTKEEYLNYLSPFFKTQIFEPCYNSIESRMGNELFGIFKKI